MTSRFKMKPRKYDIIKGIWACLWYIPFLTLYVLLAIVAFVGFGLNVAKDATRDFRR